MNQTEFAELMMTKVRAALLFDQPFFGSLALRLELVPMPASIISIFMQRGLVPTMAVDGKKLWYAENYVLNTEVDLLKSSVGHEVLHCVFDHMNRRQGREPELWNISGDYVINLVLKEAGFALKENWLYDTTFTGWSTDSVYAHLLKNRPPPDQGSGQDEQGQGHGQGQDHVLDSDEADSTQSANEWRVATIQAANSARQEGKLPAELQRFVDEILKPKNDWRERLRRFITERNRSLYSWRHLNRRFLAWDLYFPGRYGKQMSALVVIIDTSGSIQTELLRAFVSETTSAREAAKPEKTYVLSCDAAINHIGEFNRDQEMKIKLAGGGGTDFRPPFEWIEKQGIQPACVLYLTDMYGKFPDEAPSYPVLWCATTDEKAPWGETVRLEV